jgi:hypothetical protein
MSKRVGGGNPALWRISGSSTLGSVGFDLDSHPQSSLKNVSFSEEEEPTLALASDLASSYLGFLICKMGM